MTAKEILDRTAQFFTELMQPAQDASGTPAAPQKMMEAKLKDGTVVEVTDMNVGGVVTIAGTPAPVGEHELEDGTKIVLVDNGVISEIIMPQAAPAMPPMEDMSAKFAAFESATNEKFANYAAKFEAQEIQLTKMNTQLNKANKVIEQLLTLSQLIVDAPAATPDAAAKTSNNFKEEKQQAFIKTVSENIFSN